MDAGTSCWTKALATPVPVPGINATGHEGGMRLSPDELTAYFDVLYSDDAGASGTRLMMATRASRADPFGAAQTVPGLTPPAQHNYFSPTVTADGLLIVFWEDYAGARLLAATRTSTADAFGAPVAVVSAGATQPYVTPKGDALYWTDATYAIQRGDLSALNVTNQTSIDVIDFNEWNAVVSSDELVLFFATNCSGCGPSVGGWDVWVARRASKSDPFGVAEDVLEVNSAVDDFPTWISPDGCRLYLQSFRDADAGGVWVAER